MERIDYQLTKWMSCFGKKYTDRNALTLQEMDNMYKDRFGITRTKMNKLFLGNIDRSIRILEVGSNIGNQLQLLQRMGFKNLYGIEPQDYAIERAKKMTSGINIISGNIFDIPFKDGYFDLVFTSGVLIHISPDRIKAALREICRCSKKYIWGFEYYSARYKKIDCYRGEKGLLWKADFPKIYRQLKPDLKIVKIKYLNFLKEDNTDEMFLLKK